MVDVMKHGGRFLYNLLTGQVGDEKTFTLVSILNRRSSVRGGVAVLIWVVAILWSHYTIDNDTLSSDITLLLTGRTDDKKNLLSSSWFSVVGFNTMQVIVLVISSLLLTISQGVESEDGRPEECCSMFTWGIVSLGRIVTDLGLFSVSLAASVYALEAFFKLPNVQPGNDLNKEGDVRYNLINLFALLGLQVLTFSELWRRQGGKGLSSVAALKAEQKDDSSSPAQIAPDLGLNAKDNGLKIHNFY